MPLRYFMAAAACVALLPLTVSGQSNFPPEDFQAIAIVNNDLGSGAGRVDIRVTRWSSEAERDLLVGSRRCDLQHRQ